MSQPANHPTIGSELYIKNSGVMSSQSKVALVALTIGLKAGAVLIVLGAIKLFGNINAIGSIASFSCGGILFVATGGGILYIFIKNYKQLKQENTQPLETPIRGEPPDLSMSSVSEEDRVIATLFEKIASGMPIDTALKAIDEKFFANKSQERAKGTFSKAMRWICNSGVYFPKSSKVENLEGLKGVLDPTVFHQSTTFDVGADIIKSSKDKKNIHLYQVASQYNAAESASSNQTPPVGEAMKKTENDGTQGPSAQRTNPQAFEIVTAMLTHLGFNMLEKVVPSAGKTYEPSSITHGYFTPTDATLDLQTEELKNNYHQAEYVCYSSCPKEWGKESLPVYLLLQAAPYLGSPFLTKKSDELQKYAALANYLALFAQGIVLAQAANMPVVIHVTAPGTGVWGNTAPNLQWGFEKAALHFQDALKKAHIHVQLEAYQGGGTMKAFADNLSLPYKERMDHV